MKTQTVAIIIFVVLAVVVGGFIGFAATVSMGFAVHPILSVFCTVFGAIGGGIVAAGIVV